MSWMVSRGKLDDFQNSVLRDCITSTKPIWIKGSAGTGKTILLVLAAEELARNNPDETVCILAYTHTLKQLIQTGIREESLKRRIKVLTHTEFLSKRKQVFAVMLDEVQDISDNDLHKIRSFTQRLIVAGDPVQSIYEGKCTTEDITLGLKPSQKNLNVLYRMTGNIRDILQPLVPESDLQSTETGRMQEVRAVVRTSENPKEEAEWLWKKCKDTVEVDEPAAILLPTHKKVMKYIGLIVETENLQLPEFAKLKFNKPDYKAINDFLKLKNIPLRFLGNGIGSLKESEREEITYIMTCHSAKGLDFEHVFLPGLNEGAFFSKNNDSIDRRLFYVAASRSRRYLYMSYSSNTSHQYIQRMPQDLLAIESYKHITEDAKSAEPEIFF